MVRLGLIIAATVFVLDQITKWVVLGPMAFSPAGCRELHLNCGRIEISGIFDLTMVWNQGVSFGLFRADSELGRWILVAAQAGIAVIFLLWLLRGRPNQLASIALGAIVGGALGNVLDRIRFGAVADFFDFSGLGFPWVFNVADAAINVGAALLVLDYFLTARRERQARPEGEGPSGR